MCQETDHYLIRWLNTRQRAQHQGDVGTTTQTTLQADTISLLNSSIIWALAAVLVWAQKGGRAEGVK